MIFHRSSRGHEQRCDCFLQLGARAAADGAAGPAPDVALPNERIGSTREARTHAMKNCLSVIDAVAYLCEGELSEPGRERMAQLKKASARLLELIDDGG